MSLPVRSEERSDWPADCKLERLAQVPMTLISGHVAIPASINGKDVEKGIDTGGPTSGFTITAAHRLGIAGHRGNLQIGESQPVNSLGADVAQHPLCRGIIHNGFSAHGVASIPDVPLPLCVRARSLFMVLQTVAVRLVLSAHPNPDTDNFWREDSNQIWQKP
jgi:hypothetical protein